MTLDDDVAAMLNRLRSESPVGFKKVVNDLLRAGLKQSLEPRPPVSRYRTPAFDAGRCLIGSVADIQHVLSEIEGTLAR